MLSYVGQNSEHSIQIIDNCDQLFGNKQDEEQLFHDYNRAKENATYLVLALHHPVSHYNITLPDLASRLRAAPSVEILPPSEIDLQAILVKLFHDRQLKVEPGVIAYILPRIERSFTAVKELVQTIDESAMAEKRAVTVPLVRNVLSEPELFVE